MLATNMTVARLAVSGAFATQGLVLISLTTRLPQVQNRWGLSDLGLSGLLLMMILLAGAGSALAEALGVRGVATHWLLRLGLLINAASVVALLARHHTLPLMALAMASYGLALGLIDATTNQQGVELEHRYGRPILPSFYGAWTAGAAVGAAITLLMSGAGLAAGAWVALVPLCAMVLPYLPQRVVSETREELLVEAAHEVSWRRLALVGLGLVLFYMVDSAASTWGPVYLSHTFATPAGLVAWASLPYLLASGILRFLGDPLVARFGPVRVLRVGAIVSAASLLVIAAAPSWPVAVLGFTTLGAGAAVIVPLSFSAAGRLARGGGDPELVRAKIDAVIARFNIFTYLGSLLGAVLTGAIGAGNLRIGFALPMVLILLLLPLARYFEPVDEAVMNGV